MKANQQAVIGYMLELLNTMLDTAKIEAGEMVLARDPIDLCGLSPCLPAYLPGGGQSIPPQNTHTHTTFQTKSLTSWT